MVDANNPPPPAEAQAPPQDADRDTTRHPDRDTMTGGHAPPTGDRQARGVIARIIELSVHNRYLVILLVLMMASWGYVSLTRAPLDAIPDLSDTQVIIVTEWPGRSPDLVEDQITYPLSSALIAAPKVASVRGQSYFGTSFVYVIFDDDTDIYWARSRVLEYLNRASAELPDDARPVMGPDATGVGWVFQYALVDKTGRHDLQELRSLQDFRLRYALESVPGVAEVASVGGFVKQYQINLNPNALLAHQIGVQDVVRAVRRSNADAGGRVIELAGHEHIVRGRGYLRGTEDIARIPVAVPTHGIPVYLDQLGEITVGPDMRRGLAELDGEGETVGAIVVMRYGENALDVIDGIKDRIRALTATLPQGVELVVTYDRSDLIEAAVDTLKHTLIEEMLVVSLIIFLFLMHVRSALVPIIILPTAVLIAFIPMLFQGLTVNIMSLGGIAVAIGAMVDASIIIVENIHKRLEHWQQQGRPEPRMQVVIAAMQEVGPSIFFSLLLITISFLPVFTLEVTEGRLFKPLAFTKTYSMGFAAILAVTLTPALAVICIRGHIQQERDNPLSRLLVWLYTPVVRFVIRHRYSVVVAAFLAMIVTVPAYLRLGSEFMPPLNEGAILYMPTSPPGMSITQAGNVLQSMNQQLSEFPEVQRVFGKMGRAQTATDPAPLSMAETVVLLKPRDQWREGVTFESLIQEMDRSLQYPGMPNVWWMPIQTRTEMLSTGIRSKLGIKVFGDSMADIERVAGQIEATLSGSPGTRSVFAERLTGGFFIDFHIKRAEAARHGLLADDVNSIVMSAIGGINIATAVEGRERYPISVRYAREYRDDPEKLSKVLIHPPVGGPIPLGQVVDISFSTGAPMVRSEGGNLAGLVFVDIEDHVSIGDYVEDAKQLLADNVEPPSGIRLEWAGQFQYMERVHDRLVYVIPITVFLVFLLLYLNTKSLIETVIILLAVPFSLIGAIWLLYVLEYNMSIAVWVGIIALAGLDAETGVIMMLYLKLAYRRRLERGAMQSKADLGQAIIEGAAQRIRPKLMTVMTTMLGLLPIMWSVGTGADVMRRIAAPMIGGLVTSFLLELTVYPAIFAIWKSIGISGGRANTATNPINTFSEPRGHQQ